MSEARECRAGGWRLHQLGELPSECGACEAYAKGREDFRREVANALADAIESARVHDTSGYFELSALRRKLEAGTFPKPPPSSGGEGGG